MKAVTIRVDKLNATDQEITTALKELWFRQEIGGWWWYTGRNSYSGLWAFTYPHANAVTFEHRESVKKSMDFAIKLAKNFGGRLCNTQTRQCTTIKLTKERKIKRIEKRLLE